MPSPRTHHALTTHAPRTHHARTRYDDGFDAETRALKQEGDRLLPVVMATQGGDAGLAACDVVIEVDGERGLSAEDTKVRVRVRLRLRLRVRVPVP